MKSKKQILNELTKRYTSYRYWDDLVINNIDFAVRLVEDAMEEYSKEIIEYDN